MVFFLQNVLFSYLIHHIYYVLLYRNYNNTFIEKLLIKITSALPTDSLGEGAFDVYVYQSVIMKPIIWPSIYLKAIACVIDRYENYISYNSNNSFNGYARIDRGFNPSFIIGGIIGRINTTIDKNLDNLYNKINDNNYIVVFASRDLNSIRLDSNYNSNEKSLTLNSTIKLVLCSSSLLTNRCLVTQNNTASAESDEYGYFIFKNTILSNALIQTHAHSMLGIDENRNIKVRNPWGRFSLLKGYFYENGLFTMEKEELIAFADWGFYYVSFT